MLSAFGKSRRMLNAFLRHASCCANGVRFGFIYLRARRFQMPDKVRCAGRSIELHHPDEVGIHNDFLTCFIRDEYGLCRQLPQLKTIVDIGANIGLFSVAARARYPSVTIHAYEPNPRSVAYLQANTSELGITVYPEAVGSREGRVFIEDSSDSNQARTSSSNNGNIVQVGLDTVVERMGGTVDLIKIDCERAEWSMFEQAAPWQRIRNIRMEYHLLGSHTEKLVDGHCGTWVLKLSFGGPLPVLD